MDSSHVLGAAGARDTYALIRGGIRKLLRALGYTPTSKRKIELLGKRLGWYLDPEAPEKPDIDWSDAEIRAEHLKEIVQDARTALSLVKEDEPAAVTTPAVAEAATLLEKIVSDDIEEGPPSPPSGPKRRGRKPDKQQQDAEGASPPPIREEEATVQTEEEDTGPRLRRGVAKDRTLSVVDPQMRVGHKSKRRSWAGYKVHIAEDPQSELITRVEARLANEYDGEAAVGMVERQEASVGLTPKELLCDGAYGSADVRAELKKKLGVEVVAKLRPLTDSKHLGKDEFEIDLLANPRARGA